MDEQFFAVLCYHKDEEFAYGLFDNETEADTWGEEHPDRLGWDWQVIKVSKPFYGV